MNLESFFGGSSTNKNKVESTNEQRTFTTLQLQLLEERRAAEWLHTNIKESITEKSKEHDEQMLGKMTSLGLTDEDYLYFIENYNKFSMTNTTLH